MDILDMKAVQEFMDEFDPPTLGSNSNGQDVLTFEIKTQNGNSLRLSHNLMATVNQKYNKIMDIIHSDDEITGDVMSLLSSAYVRYKGTTYQNLDKQTSPTQMKITFYNPDDRVYFKLVYC